MIMYSIKDPPLSIQLDKLTKECESDYNAESYPLVDSIEKLINLQYRIMSHHARWFLPESAPIKRHRKLNPFLFRTFHDNLLFTFSALELNRKGLHGAASNLIRHIFEALIIAKYCDIATDFKILDKWSGNDPIFLTRDVLRKIKSPDPAPLKELWIILCNYSHPTKNSGQAWIDLEDDEFNRGIFINLIFLNMLLECNYHLLNTHMIDDRMEYEAKLYIPQFNNQKYEIPHLRKQAHTIFKESRVYFGKESKRFIQTYKRKWELI